nr:MAG TPA: hypothetical protein [Caudoviricetes sp.]
MVKLLRIRDAHQCQRRFKSDAELLIVTLHNS